MRRLIALLLITVTGGFLVGTTVDARAADPAAESTFLTLTNQVRASRGLPGLGVHPVLVAKAQAWAAHMAATGCLCHSNLTDGVTVGWRKIGENVGVGPNIGAIHNALVASPPHLANMLDPQFHWVGIGVAYGGGRMWVSEVFMDGDAPPIDPALLLKLDSRGRGIAARAQGGFWILSGNGNVGAYEGAPNLGHPTFGSDIARDIVAMPDGNGYAILDGFGGVHKYGSAVAQLSGLRGSPYWNGWDIARSIALAPGRRRLRRARRLGRRASGRQRPGRLGHAFMARLGHRSQHCVHAARRALPPRRLRRGVDQRPGGPQGHAVLRLGHRA